MTRRSASVRLLGVGIALALQRLFLGDEARQRRLGVGGLPALALDIGGKLDEPLVELDHAVLGAGFFLFESFARDHQPLQRGGGPRFGVAQRRHRGGGLGLAGGSLRLRAGLVADHADGEVAALFGFRQLGIGADPAQMEQRGLGGAHLRRDVAVADRLPRLLLERVDLAGELVDDVLDAREVLLGGAQPKLGLVAPRVQAGNAGRLFQHTPALLRLRLDDLADAALVHQSRRARAGRSVGEQDVDVAGAHLAAVDAVGRTLFALDPARDVELLVLVELRRRLAVRVVDQHRDFGVVARRPAVGAGEDHVVHVGGAQRFVRGLAHHPAQRLDQVGLPAPVRPDHAGQPRLDQEVRGLDERLEAEQAQAREFHVAVIPKSRRGRWTRLEPGSIAAVGTGARGKSRAVPIPLRSNTNPSEARRIQPGLAPTSMGRGGVPHRAGE